MQYSHLGHDTSGFMPTFLSATQFLSQDTVAQGPDWVASHTAILCWAFFAVLHHCIVHNLDATHVLNEDAMCPSGTSHIWLHATISHSSTVPVADMVIAVANGYSIKRGHFNLPRPSLGATIPRLISCQAPHLYGMVW